MFLRGNPTGTPRNPRHVCVCVYVCVCVCDKYIDKKNIFYFRNLFISDYLSDYLSLSIKILYQNNK